MEAKDKNIKQKEKILKEKKEEKTAKISTIPESENKERDMKESSKKRRQKRKIISFEEYEKQNQELKELQQKLQETKERYLRLSADFDNFRKRSLKEKIELIKTAGEEIIKELLPIMDDFERGLQSLSQTKDISAIKEGVQLIYNKFSELLKSKGVQAIEEKDVEFDTDYHEAVSKIQVDDHNKKGKVIDVIQKGYKLNDKVIRYSKVVVGA